MISSDKLDVVDEFRRLNFQNSTCRNNWEKLINNRNKNTDFQQNQFLLFILTDKNRSRIET